MSRLSSRLPLRGRIAVVLALALASASAHAQQSRGTASQRFTLSTEGAASEITYAWRTATSLFPSPVPESSLPNSNGSVNVPLDAGVFVQHDASSRANQQLPQVWAFASTDVGLANLDGGPLLVGRNLAAEINTITDLPGYSASMLAVNSVVARGGTQLRNGSVSWWPGIISTAHATRNVAIRTASPIAFVVQDLVTGARVSRSLVQVESWNRGGTFVWNGELGRLSVEATEFVFRIDMSSPFTSVNGTLDLVVAGGIVTTASSSGIFARMLLPSVGSGGTFTTALEPIAFDFALPDPGGGAHPLDVRLSFANLVIANAHTVPEPGPLALLGSGVGLLVAIRTRRHHSRRGPPPTA